MSKGSQDRKRTNILMTDKDQLQALGTVSRTLAAKIGIMLTMTGESTTIFLTEGEDRVLKQARQLHH
jgi:hypothetical protein